MGPAAGTRPPGCCALWGQKRFRQGLASRSGRYGCRAWDHDAPDGAGSARNGDGRRAARLLLLIELSQGVIGFWQYFTDLPELLVGIHMLGAGMTSAGITWVLVASRTRGWSDST